MKILIFTTEFPPYIGGAGTYSLTLANALAKKGNTISILTRDYRTPEQGELDNNLKNQNITCYRLPWIKKISLYFWKKKVIKYLQQHSCDKVIICNDGAQIICSSSKVKKVLPEYIVVIHGTELKYYFEKTNLNSFFYNKKNLIQFFMEAKKVIAISNSTKNWILAHMELQNIKVILNCIDTKLFYYDEDFATKRSTLLEQYKLSTNDIILLTASRLIPEKGQDMLLRAFAKLKQNNPDIQLLVCSDGPFKKTLIKLSKRLKISKYVCFTGKVSISELRDLYQLADIFILLTRQGKKEGFGLVYLEANAAKTAVVGSTHGGVPEAVIEGENGVLVNPCNLNDIYSKIELLIQNKDLRNKFAEQGYTRVQNYFNEDRFAQDFLDCFYESTL